MNEFIYLFYLLFFAVQIFIYYKMIELNQEEWLYTNYTDAIIITLIPGLVIGAIGYLLFKNILLCIPLGLLSSSLSVAFNLFLFNLRVKRKVYKSKGIHNNK